MRFKPLLISVAVATLAGCAFTQLGDPGKHELTEVGHRTYRLYLFEPWQENFDKFREDIMIKARAHCEKDDFSGQLIDAVSARKAPGIEGIILFKCVRELPPPPDSGLPNTKRIDLPWTKDDKAPKEGKPDSGKPTN